MHHGGSQSYHFTQSLNVFHHRIIAHNLWMIFRVILVQESLQVTNELIVLVWGSLQFEP